jgi:hypothetical protein
MHPSSLMRIQGNLCRLAQAVLMPLAMEGLGVLSATAAAPPMADAVEKRIAALRADVAIHEDAARRAESRNQSWLAFARAEAVAADWIAQDLGASAPDLLDPATAPATLERLAAAADIETGDGFWKAWIHSRDARRAGRLADATRRWGPWVFTEGHTFRMSFIGYTEGLSDARAERFFQPGARLTLLEFANGSAYGTPRSLIDDPHGMMRDADISFDRSRVVFAWKKSDRLDDYHLYEHHLADGSIRQLTSGLGRADYEPAYLPGGDIVFASTRPEQSVPCWWTEISNLYRIDGDGRGLRRLAIDQVHTLYPQLMADGRLTYTRWDYSDRGQNFTHPLFSMRPDGRDQRAFYGANSWFPNSLLHARGIPGSHEVVAIASGHHTRQQGKLVIIDNTQGRDEGMGMRFIAPTREVPYERVDVAMQKGDQFRYPYPLGDGQFLVSFRPEHGVPNFGLYWIHENGARELLHVAHDGLETGRPVPTGHRPAVTDMPEVIDFGNKTATYFVMDVYQGTGLQGIPRGEAKWIRVVRLNYRAAGVGRTFNHGEDGGSLNSAPVGIANTTWDVKEILGDVEIHADGSALFEVPAMESIYLQVLDARGRVIQTTRSWDTLRPGETKGCIGCHDKANANFHPYGDNATMAWKHGVQKLRPFHGPTRGFSFRNEIQPILDSKCVSCHDASADAAPPDLRDITVDGNNTNQRAWSKSYLNLLEATYDEKQHNWIGDPDKGLVRWIHKQSRPTELPPYHAGAARSPLLDMIDEGHHEVKLDDVEFQKLAAWIDLLVPFAGDYREGGHWSERDHAYYTYYETKRTLQHKEEQASLQAWLAKIHSEPITPLGPLTARYRPVLENLRLIQNGENHTLPADHAAVLIDRLVLHIAEPMDGIEIRNTRTGKVVGRGAGSDIIIALTEPVRSDRLVLSGAGATAVTLVAAHGVTPAEIPVVGSFHPHLAGELPD